MQQNKSLVKKLLIDRCLVLLSFSALLPVINLYTGTWYVSQSLQEFAFNVSIFVFPLVLFGILLQKGVIKKNELSTQIWTAVFAYIALFAFCFFNATIFVEQIDFILSQYVFGSANVASFTLRWLITITLFFFLTHILMRLFTYVRIFFEKDE